MQTLNREQIVEILPHRFENLLIDDEDISVTDDIKKGELRLRVSSGDPLGRNVFFKELEGSKVFIEQTYMEILALGSIVAMGRLGEGVTAFFSSITNYLKSGDIAEGEILIGEVEKGKAKGDFHRFNGKIKSSSGAVIAEGDLMAYAMRASNVQIEIEKKPIALPETKLNKIIDRSDFSWKDPQLVFVDSIIDFNAAEGLIISKYTYPLDHRFTRGHFPGNPVMMGITLWIAATDAQWLFVRESTDQGAGPLESVTVTGDIDILRSDGVMAAEIKNCCSRISIKDGRPAVQEVLSTRKLYFREVIKPGDTLYIIARNITIEK